MSDLSKAEAAVAYAAAILADADVQITAEKLQTLLKAANIEDVEPIWTTLFAKALEGKDVKDLMVDISTAGVGTTQDRSRDPVDDGDKDVERSKTPDDDRVIECEGSDDESVGVGGLFD
ncbi:MAG: hypothetical protein M1820_008385 [Bogoriella megaspora]|nr:MAG: hypothetical protein M1820_008385 [Bogoriella megaspora]